MGYDKTEVNIINTHMKKTDRQTLFCRRCGQEKPQRAYYAGRTYACMDCIKARVNAYKRETDYNRRYRGAVAEHTEKTLMALGSGCGTRNRLD
jgi:late competence protein required for DNA uptake (superfamily II DNA/RNA helicase)